jgi:O-antigen ligase
VGYFRILEFVKLDGGINWEGTSGRNVVYQTTLQLIEQRPILGYGLFGMWDVYSSYPHNLFLEVLLQGGVFYLLIALIVLFYFAIKLAHLIRKDMRFRILIVLFIYPFVMLMFSGTYLSTPMFWFVIIYVMNSRLETANY